MYLQDMLTNHIFNIYVKTGFGIKQSTMLDMPQNLIKPNHIYLIYM